MKKGRTHAHLAHLAAWLLVPWVIAGCGGGGGGGMTSATPPAMDPAPQAEMIPPPLDPTGQNLGQFFAVTSGNRFVTFNPGATAFSTNVAIADFGSTEHVVGVDVRTADGMVVVVSEGGGLFELDPRSGATRVLGSTVIGGAQVGVEFLSAPEEIRLVGATGESGALAGIANLDPELKDSRRVLRLPSVTPGVTEIAASQAAIPCGGPSILYYLDTSRDMLFMERREGENIVLDPVGSLGVDAEAAAGFEIFQREDGTDVAVATLRVSGVLSLYGIDLSTGRASMQSPIPGLRRSETLVGLARPPLIAPPRLGNTVALTQDGKLISFDHRAPLAICTPATAVAGLQTGEQILDLDVRPADGLLYALTNAGRLYTLSTALGSFGVATLKSILQPRPEMLPFPKDSFQGLTRPTASIEFDAGRDELLVRNGNAPDLTVDVDSGEVSTSIVMSYSGSA